MNIEKSIEILKEFRNYNKFYKEENRDLTITITLEAKESIDKAIERLLTAYEKEKEKIQSFEYALSNGEIETVNYFSDIAPTLLINSYTHGKEVLNFIKRNFISKDKIKAKIEEVEKYSKEHGYINMRSELDILQSLLEKE